MAGEAAGTESVGQAAQGAPAQAAATPAQPSAADQQARIAQFQEETAARAAARIEQQFANKFLTPDQISAAVTQTLRNQFAPPPPVDPLREEAKLEPAYRFALEDAKKAAEEQYAKLAEKQAQIEASFQAQLEGQRQRENAAGYQAFNQTVASILPECGAFAPYVKEAIELKVRASIGTPYDNDPSRTFQWADLASPQMQAVVLAEARKLQEGFAGAGKQYYMPPEQPANVIPIAGSNGQVRAVPRYTSIEDFQKAGGYDQLMRARSAGRGR